MDPEKKLIGIVIKPDGTVPFDADLHPAHRAAMLEHLTALGHVHAPVEGTSHVKIQNWAPPKAT